MPIQMQVLRHKKYLSLEEVNLGIKNSPLKSDFFQNLQC
jgi:hypothetical protein